MLIGLVTIVLPIWIHFRRQRKAALHFPAVEILSKVAQRREPKLRLRGWILLALRILSLIAIVLAASRPGLVVERPGGVRAGAELAVVIVLDDSLSMRLADGKGKTLFDRAKSLIAGELQRLRPGDAAALVLSGYPARALSMELEFNLDHIQRLLDQTRPGYRSGDINNALQLAIKMLEESPLAQREIILVTDLADNSFKKSTAPSPVSSGVAFRVLDAGPGVPRSNTALTEIRLKPSPEGDASEVIIEAEVTNYSPGSLDRVEVILEVDDIEVARGNVEVPALSSVAKRFHHQFGVEGMHRGQIRIAGDALVEDNRRHFAVSVRRSISALIIDGDFRPGSYRDEAFYLLRALKTPIPGDVPIRTVVVDAKTASAAPLTGNSVVFLVGMATIDRELAQRLVEFVQGGGGLFVSPAPGGSQLSAIESVLPGKLRSVKQAPRKGRRYRVTTINRAHPVFHPFGAEPSGLEGTRVEAHLLVDPLTAGSRTTLIELASGLPLLLERQVGRGSVMLLTTTIDRDWTDLPIRPGFLPLIQRATRHLAGRLDDRSLPRIQVGRPISLEVSQGMQRLIVRGPDKQDVTYTVRELAGKTAIEFTHTQLPGHYRVWAEIPEYGGLKEIVGLEFVVETDPAESDLTKVAESVDDADAEKRFAPVAGKLPIWPYLLLLAMIFALAETWVSGYGLRRSHIAANGRRASASGAPSR